MRKKIEIKVYLPYLMVGELESRRKNNVRSKFIEEAIRNRLDGQEKFDLWDIDDKEILKMARVIANKNHDNVLKTILSNRLEELEE